MKIALLASTLALALAGTAVSAQTVDQRHDRQQQRIDRGVASGQLTPHEANKLERQQAHIDRAERRDRYRHGGRLTPNERAHLQRRENGASADIYRQKHDRQYY